MTKQHTFADRLTALREAAGLSIYALARQAGVGRDLIGQYESGRRTPNLETAAKLAAALKCSLSEFDGLTWGKKA